MPFFFFNDTATTEIYTLSLHDALPISPCRSHRRDHVHREGLESDLARRPRRRDPGAHQGASALARDRKSTRLNSSHVRISYAVFCLKKKKQEAHTSQAWIDAG